MEAIRNIDFEWPERLHNPAAEKSKSESYACSIQRVPLLNSRECEYRLAPPSRWLLEWGGFAYATRTHAQAPIIQETREGDSSGAMRDMARNLATVIVAYAILSVALGPRSYCKPLAGALLDFWQANDAGECAGRYLGRPRGAGSPHSAHSATALRWNQNPATSSMISTNFLTKQRIPPPR